MEWGEGGMIETMLFLLWGGGQHVGGSGGLGRKGCRERVGTGDSGLQAGRRWGTEEKGQRSTAV